MIRYNKKKNITPLQLFNLYKSVGWVNKRDKKDQGKFISKAYKNSQVVISAWDGKELVRVIRGLTDKVANGVIFGLVVKPKYQRQGIGKKLVNMCIKEYPNINWFLGSTNKKTNKFYEKIGFKKEKDSWFGKKGKI